jgi:CubicO group peptidase (beta-lactamase class C family)
MKLLWMFFATLWVCTNILQARDLDTVMLKKRIPEMMDSAGVPGLSVGVIKKGKLVWSKNFGLANKATQKRATKNTVFEAASLSKPMFAFICMKLVEQGILDLDKPLTEYVSKDSIEKFFLFHKIQDNRFYKITARMCLSHSAGLPNGRYGYVSINFDPATDMHYSGEGISYLQFVVEHLTRKNLQVLAKEYVFEPLSMDSSSYVWEEERFRENISDSHGSGGQTVIFTRKNWKPMASYSLITNAEDYGKFMAMMLSQQGLKKETYEEMWKIQSKAKTNFLASMNWGLGVGLYETELGRAFWHWGDMGTVKAYMIGIPQEKSGVVLFTNSANGLNMAYNLIEMCIGGKNHDFFKVLNIQSYDDPVNILFQRFSQGGISHLLESYNYYKVNHKYRVTQNLLNQLTQRLLSLGRSQEALNIAKINILEFPESDTAHDILGDVYLRLGQRLRAIGCYKRSYQLNPSGTYAKKQLISLKAL